GRPGAVTIATNMAGRGTDILLGGNWKSELAKIDSPTPEQEAALKAEWQKNHELVLAAGGLHIVGSERHESRRIDNQLRGRSGRQGDPGVTRFYLSLEDDLMRIFASDRVKNMMRSLGMQKGEAIEHRWVTRSIENAQRKVEARNFDIRKNLLKYDDVANDQRRAIYSQRDAILESASIAENVERIHDDVLNTVISEFVPPQSMEEQWEIDGLEKALAMDFGATLTIRQWLDSDESLGEEGLRERISAAVLANYKAKREQIGAEVADQLEKQLMLQILDRHWKEHLASMDYLRQGIHLRGYAQKNPEQEYKREAFQLFEQLLGAVKLELVQTLARVQVQSQEEVEAIEAQRLAEAESMALQYQHADADAVIAEEQAELAAIAKGEQPLAAPEPFVREGAKVGRNDPCPCGSGKKYKHCHGQLA
ncbi:MAG TPA: SEC-C metal-binding domain-containing protein, partial [Moraxellaceae bacterium]